MALQKNTVSVNLGNTLDQQDDDKVGLPGTFEVLKDWVRNKFKRLDKRFGTRKLSTTVSTSFPNPLAIGSSDIPSSLFTYGDQLLEQNKGVLYSRQEDQNRWNFTNHYYPVEADWEVIQSSLESYSTPNIGMFGGKTIYAYSATKEENTSVRVTIIENDTGTRVVDAALVQDGLAFPDEPLSVHVLTFTTGVYVLYVTGNLIRIASVNTASGAIGAPVTLKTDYRPSAGFGFTDLERMDFCLGVVTTGSLERAFVAYPQTGNFYAVFSITPAGIVDATMGTTQRAFAPQGGYWVHFNNTTQKFYVGYSSSLTVSVDLFNVTPTGITFASTVDIDTAAFDPEKAASFPAIRGSFCESLTSPSNVIFVYDLQNADAIGGNPTCSDILKFCTLSATAIVTPAAVYGRGLRMSGKIIRDTVRQTVYIPTQNYSPARATSTFLLDLFRGKVEDSVFVVAKYDAERTEAANASGYLPSVISLGDVNRSYVFPSVVKTRLSSDNQLIAFFDSGIGANTVQLAPTYGPSRVFINGGTHVSGGYLGYYDGSQFCEHGFFIQPAELALSVRPSNAVVSATIDQQGDASNPEITTFTFQGGGALVSASQYFTFSTTANNFYVWYRKDGVGTDPAPGGTGIPVDISSYDTAFEVAKKTQQQMSATFGIGDADAVQFSSSITVTNQLNGAVTDASVAAITNIGTLAAGARSYALVYGWTDVHGRQFLSSPTQVSGDNSAGFSNVLEFAIPPVTNRIDCSSMYWQLYRTKAGETNLLFLQDGYFNKDQTTEVIVDTAADSSLDANRLLYTTGGILANYSFPAVRALAKFKNRIVLSSIDRSKTFYSKEAVFEQPMEFSDLLEVPNEDNGEDVTGHFQLDDKLIIFREVGIIARAGDGANDLGEGTTFSQPSDIATDTGCVHQNTIELGPSGLFFRSRMGIQHIDRGLNVTYKGVSVKDYNNTQVGRALLLKDDERVREVRFILSTGTDSLVYDYLTDLWGSFSSYGGQDACLWKGDFTRVDSAGNVYVEDKSIWVDQDSAVETYSPILETTWLKFKDVQDFQRVWKMAILGELKSAHTLNFKIYYDYDLTAFDEYNFDSSQISGGTGRDASVYQPEIHLKRQKCQSIKIRMEVIPNAITPGTEESLTLTDMSFTCGMKQGLNKVSARKKI